MHFEISPTSTNQKSQSSCDQIQNHAPNLSNKLRNHQRQREHHHKTCRSMPTRKRIVKKLNLGIGRPWSLGNSLERPKEQTRNHNTSQCNPQNTPLPQKNQEQSQQTISDSYRFCGNRIIEKNRQTLSSDFSLFLQLIFLIKDRKKLRYDQQKHRHYGQESS